MIKTAMRLVNFDVQMFLCSSKVHSLQRSGVCSRKFLDLHRSGSMFPSDVLAFSYILVDNSNLCKYEALSAARANDEEMCLWEINECSIGRR